MDLILASTSRYRKALIARLGVPFRCVDPAVDEDAWKARLADAPPRVLAETLAREKARAVAAQFPDAAVVGGDQVVAFDGAILGKPGTADRAEAQLGAMAGRSHELITALAVVAPGREFARTEVATLRLRPLTPAAIARYVAADHPVDCAGSYKLEERGIALFERIEAEDHSAITGVPLMALTSILLELGFAIP